MRRLINVGPGMTDYQPIHLEFLWVRWYRRVSTYDSWIAHKLDRLKFCNVEDTDAFSFVDPSDILRGCHIVPRFREGQCHSDGKGVSLCARDALDWKEYYVNRSVHLQSSSKHPFQTYLYIYRFVDRDMLMRYHFGLGVGHTYLPCPTCNLSKENAGEFEGNDDATNVDSQAMQPIDGEVGDHGDIISDEDSEVLDESDDEAVDDIEEDDYELLAMDEMYGF